MATAAARLGEFISSIEREQIPQEARHAAALHVLDTFGCGLAAYAMGESRYAAAAVAEDGVTVVLGLDGQVDTRFVKVLGEARERVSS